MRTTVTLLCRLLVGSAALAGGCGSDHKTRKPQDPLETKVGFCTEWGKRACNQTVADACLATDVDECASRQTEFCIGIVADTYAKDNATACLDKVRDAFVDARLTADERDVVLHLHAPCDKLYEGPLGAGEPCLEDSACNTLEGLKCVIPLGQNAGTCEIPVIQGGGRSCGQPNQVCETGFYCNGSNCVESQAVGEPCTAAEPCSEDAICAGEVGATVCMPKLADRESCTEDEQCISRICAKSGSSGRCAPSIVLDAADPLCENFAQ